MNQTAMQELIKYLKQQINEQHSQGFVSALELIKTKATSLLPTEREQIEAAYQQGAKNEYMPHPVYKDCAEYFTTTYSADKPTLTHNAG